MESNKPSLNSTTEKTKHNNTGRGITVKVLILLGMLLVMQIPVFMIRDLISERQNLGYKSESDIVSSWGAGALLTQAKVAMSMFCFRNVKWYGENE